MESITHVKIMLYDSISSNDLTIEKPIFWTWGYYSKIALPIVAYKGWNGYIKLIQIKIHKK